MVYAVRETNTSNHHKNITPLLLQFQQDHYILLSICSGHRGHWPVVLSNA